MIEPVPITTGAMPDGSVRLSIDGRAWVMSNETAIVLSRMLDGSAKRQTAGLISVYLHQE